MEPVRTGLRQLMSELLRARPAEEAVLLAWPIVCGSKAAERSRAVSFSDGILVVEVADAGWRSQLQSFAPRYVSGYAELLGPLVRSVEFSKQSAEQQRSAFSVQRSAEQQSALSAQRSAKPVRSASTNKVNRSKKRPEKS
jgi:Dna[CI] antecedent, DciA